MSSPSDLASAWPAAASAATESPTPPAVTAAGAVRSAQRYLMLAWLSLATVAIGIATVYAVVLVAARTPQLVRLLPAGDLFHTALVLHVDLAAVIWFAAMAGALWSAAAAARLLWLRWAAFGLSAGGVAAMALAPLLVPGAPMANNYVPVLDSPLFLGGLAWFFVGCAMNALPVLLPQGRTAASAVLTPLRLAALLALASLAAIALAAASLPDGLDRGLYFELLSWGPGHIAQFAFTLLMLTAWLVLAAHCGLQGPPPVLLSSVWVLAALPLLPAALLAALYPPDAILFRKGYTALMAFGAWPAPLLLASWLLPRLLRQRGGGESGGARQALVFSMLLFAAGCVLGGFIRTDSTMVPAHYHGTVGGVTLGLMGLLLNFACRSRNCEPPRAARWLPWIYGGGLALMVVGLAWLALEGAARKTPLIAAGGESAGHMAASILTGAGGLLAIGGGGLFVWLAAGMLWARRPMTVEPGDLLPPRVDAAPPGAHARRRDVRLRAIALTAGGVAILGMALAYTPTPASLRDAIAMTLAGFSPVDKSSHAAQKRREEIQQRFSQGVLMLHAKEYDHAVAALHRVIELAPEMPEAHVNMGYALIGLGRYEAARDFFESALALRRDQLNAYYGLAIALEGLNDLPSAIGAMRTYAHLAPADDPFRTKAEASLAAWQEQLARARGTGTARRPPSETAR